MPEPPHTDSPDALLFISSRCPHCPTVLDGLRELVKAGAIGTLKVINVEQRAGLAAERNVRTVPWLELGPYHLEGLHSHAELRDWAQRAYTETGARVYFETCLQEGKVTRVLDYLADQPQHVAALIDLLGTPDTPLNIRVGAGAVLEDLVGRPAMEHAVPILGALTDHADARARADACHFLGISGDRDAIPFLRAHVDDEDADVREVARESLAEFDERA